jgi:hypothetical protein
VKRLADARRRSLEPLAIGSLLVVALAADGCDRAPSSPTGAPTSSGSGPVTGVVLDDGKPLGDASVEMWGEARTPGTPPWRIDARADVTGPLSSGANNSGPATVGFSGAPPTLVAGQRRISGTVYTLTPAGMQPVAGASAYVDLSDSVIFADLFVAPFQVPTGVGVARARRRHRGRVDSHVSYRSRVLEVLCGHS